MVGQEPPQVGGERGEAVSGDTFYFNPADESEWPIHDGDTLCDTCSLPYSYYDKPRARTVPESAGHYCKDCNESYPVTLVFNLDGYRGHYLAADYVMEAVSYLRDTRHTFTIETIERLLECEKDAVTYHRHNELSSPDNCTEKDGESCTCTYIHDSADYVESVLGENGYLTFWNDGVYVYQPIARPTTDDD